MIITVLKTTFPKAKPRIVTIRDFSKYKNEAFGRELKINLETKGQHNYESFENIFLYMFRLFQIMLQKMIY